MASGPPNGEVRHYHRHFPSVHWGRGWRKTVVETVVKEVGGSSTYLQLTSTNYEDWSPLMSHEGEARGSWSRGYSGAVKYGAADRQDDMIAVDAILSAISPEMIRTLTL